MSPGGAPAPPHPLQVIVQKPEVAGDKVGISWPPFVLDEVDESHLVMVMVGTRRFLDQVQGEFARRHGHGTGRNTPAAGR